MKGQNEPELYHQQFAKFQVFVLPPLEAIDRRFRQDWMQDCLSAYRNEIWQLSFPLFVYSYFRLLQYQKEVRAVAFRGYP